MAEARDIKRVKTTGGVFTLTALDGREAGIVGITLFQKIAPILTAIGSWNIEVLNNEIRKIFNPDELMDLFEKVINVNLLEDAGGSPIVDWREHFAKKPFAFYQLGMKAIEFNCQDFFDFISGWLKKNLKGESLTGAIQRLKNAGLEVPPEVSFLFQNGLESPKEEASQPQKK